MRISWLRGPDESGGFDKNDEFGENGETAETSPRFLTNLKYFMRMSWLRGPDESAGFEKWMV